MRNIRWLMVVGNAQKLQTALIKSAISDRFDRPKSIGSCQGALKFPWQYSVKKLLACHRESFIELITKGSEVTNCQEKRTIAATITVQLPYYDCAVISAYQCTALLNENPI